MSRLRLTAGAWRLLALWAVAAIVVVLAVTNALPGVGGGGKAKASKTDPQISAARTPAGSGSAGASQRRAQRSAARASASQQAAAKAAQQRGQNLLDTLAPVTMSGQSALVSIGGVDLATGERVSWTSSGFGTDTPAYTASIAKLDIAEALMLSKADAGADLTDSEVSWLTSMITVSDNDAADALFNDVGGKDALTALNQRLGLTGTVIGDNGEWGLTTTTVDDQLKLLENLMQPGGPLSDAAKQQILGLMGNVASDQAWGVSAGGTDPRLKNGWLPLDDGLWVMNSVGVVNGANGHQLMLVIISNGWESEPEGEDTLGSLAQNLAQSLTS